MAKTQTVDVPDELKKVEGQAIERRDRFILGVCQGHKSLPSKVQKKLIREKSLFGFLAGFWRELSPEQKQVWADASVFSSLTNWQLFVSDNSARIRDELPLDVPPSELWQVRAGRILIEAPASEIILKQEHPLDYYVQEKVPGKPWKYNLVLLRETFNLPIDLEIRYKADLTVFGSTQSARFFARVWSSYQGVDSETDISIDFNPSTDWTFDEVSLSNVRGHIIGYTLFLEIIGYRGEILFDNIRAIHGGTNWARDPRCDNVNKTFQKAFALVPPFWIPVSKPAGAEFYSSFPPSLG